MTTTYTPLRAAHERLLSARRTGTPVAPVRDFIAADDVRTAYAVQQAWVRSRLDDGASVIGRKIGLTSPVVQAQLGVDRPDFGVLLTDMQRTQDEPIDTTDLLQPRIEAEVAFVLATDITDSEATAASVREAVAHAVAALEIVDSRIAGWDITFVDTVADNASSGLFVLGDASVPIGEVEPRDVGMAMTIDGEVVSTGNGAACLGDPLAALAWLARTSVHLGDPLRAGEVILSGALGPMAAVPPGAHVRAEISGLGDVSATFATA